MDEMDMMDNMKKVYSVHFVYIVHWVYEVMIYGVGGVSRDMTIIKENDIDEK